MGSGKSDVVFNILRLVCPGENTGSSAFGHRAFITSEKTQEDFLDTFQSMIKLRSTGKYKSGNAKYYDGKLYKQNGQGSDPGFMVDSSYARLTVSSTAEDVKTALSQFYQEAKRRVDLRKSETAKWETLVFIFDEAHMYSECPQKMGALHTFINQLYLLEGPLNAVFVFLSGTLLSDRKGCDAWKTYLQKLSTQSDRVKHDFVVSYLNELPVTLRPKYEIKRFEFDSDVHGVPTSPPDDTMTLDSCLAYLKVVMKHILKTRSLKGNGKYLLFLPQIPRIAESGEVLGWYDLLSDRANADSDVRRKIKQIALDLNEEEQKGGRSGRYHLLDDENMETALTKDHEDRIQNIIDSSGGDARTTHFGIAKADDASHNNILLRMFGRVKDIESDVNVDRLEDELNRLQLLITSVCTTGADFVGVSDVYFVGKPKDNSEFKQNMYRAIRMCSHALSDMRKGVKIHTVGFDEDDDVCNDAHVRADLDIFMERCVDAVRGPDDSIMSQYTLETSTPTPFGKSLRAYERIPVADKEIRNLQMRRTLQIQGYTEQHAPQFIMDSKEDIKTFLRYTLIPSPAVIRFVRQYGKCEDLTQRMRCVMGFYYRDTGMSVEYEDAAGVEDGGASEHLVRDGESLSILQLWQKLYRFNQHLEHLEGKLQAGENMENFYRILHMLTEINTVLQRIGTVTFEEEPCDDGRYMDVHRFINAIGFRVAKLIKGRYAYIIKSLTGEDNKIATYGILLPTSRGDTLGAISNEITYMKTIDHAKEVAREGERETDLEKTREDIVKAYQQTLQDGVPRNVYLNMAKIIFKNLTSCRKKILKQRAWATPEVVSWQYSALFDVFALRDFCTNTESINPYLDTISIFTPSNNCDESVRRSVMNHTFGVDRCTSEDVLLADGNCDVWMNMVRYEFPETENARIWDHFVADNKVALPQTKPEEDALLRTIRGCVDSKLPTRVVEVRSDADSDGDTPVDTWYTRKITLQLDGFDATLQRMILDEWDSWFRDVQGAVEAATEVQTLFDMYLEYFTVSDEPVDEAFINFVRGKKEDIRIENLSGVRMAAYPQYYLGCLSCVYTEESIKRRIVQDLQSFHEALRRCVFKVGGIIFLITDKALLVSQLRNDTQEYENKTGGDMFWFLFVDALEKTDDVYSFFQELNRKRKQTMDEYAEMPLGNLKIGDGVLQKAYVIQNTVARFVGMSKSEQQPQHDTYDKTKHAMLENYCKTVLIHITLNLNKARDQNNCLKTYCTSPLECVRACTEILDLAFETYEMPKRKKRKVKQVDLD
ncbi:hypothetical protein CYMTET_47710 [Cymbomonas tetramitiformis]|uniref:Uncharacterized protein n=1 Tax=Cymbomonas tetramitiformis TaxID=36881 RepID=A0AAE0BTK8_9CHLO|nr:hypothetical protein CYMTET_47710 [Cymbomonas tetramitiformis]